MSLISVEYYITNIITICWYDNYDLTAVHVVDAKTPIKTPIQKSESIAWQIVSFCDVKTIATITPFARLQLIRRPGPRLNIKTVFPRYGDSHVKDKTVGETVLSLTWESLYW